MKKAAFIIRILNLLIIILLISNFSASAQKTTIWIVNHAESDGNSDRLSDTGKQRAGDLARALKHAGVEAIYITNKKISSATAYPLAAQAKILPRVYTDSVQKFTETLKRNFIGKNVLVVATYNTIIPLLSAFGVDSPFDALDKGDYDQLFTITLKPSGDADCEVRYYGKKHHDNEIPQSYILDNLTLGMPQR